MSIRTPFFLFETKDIVIFRFSLANLLHDLEHENVEVRAIAPPGEDVILTVSDKAEAEAEIAKMPKRIVTIINAIDNELSLREARALIVTIDPETIKQKGG